MRSLFLLFAVLFSLSLSAQTEKTYVKRFSSDTDTIDVSNLDKVELIRTTKDFAELKISVEVSSSEEVADALGRAGAFDLIQHSVETNGHKKTTLNQSPTSKRIPVGIEIKTKYMLYIPSDKEVKTTSN